MMERFGYSAMTAALCISVLPLAQALAPAWAEDKQSSASSAVLGKKKDHRLIVQVNASDPAVMNLALNNALNVVQHYRGIGEQVRIEIVAFGPGLNMLRDDTSPVKDRIRTLAETSRSISFSACENTRSNMSRLEQKEIPLISQATVVPSGVVRILELQEQGWSYVRP